MNKYETDLKIILIVLIIVCLPVGLFLGIKPDSKPIKQQSIPIRSKISCARCIGNSALWWFRLKDNRARCSLCVAEQKKRIEALK